MESLTLLTLIAIYVPAEKRATWFALMTSLMNLALVARRLQTKYLNGVFVIERGNYDELGSIMIITSVIGLVPLLVIFLLRRRL